MRDLFHDVQPISSAVPASPRTRRGFSFPEVLFAVIVLGIGFIMVAAIFPVALQQSKMTQDETASASGAWAKVGEIQNATQNNFTPVLPASNWPVTFMATTDKGNSLVTVRPVENYTGTLTPAWSNVRGLEILQDDPRYACVYLYRRAGSPGLVDAVTGKLPSDWSGTAQIYCIQVICQGTQRSGGATTLKINGTVPAGGVPARVLPVFDQYDYSFDQTGTADNTPGTSANSYSPTITFKNPNNLAAHQVLIQMSFNYNGLGVNVLKLNTTTSDTAGGSQNLPNAIAEGAYVVIAEDPTATSTTHTNITGRIYRVGLRRQDLDKPAQAFFELQPGSDSQSTLEDLAGDTPAFCVGKERLADTGSGPQFIGGAQDVSIYTTTIPVKP